MTSKGEFSRLVLMFLSLTSGAASVAQSPEFKAIQERAGNGAAWAQFDLGQRYEFGDGVKADSKKAVKWYRKSAEQGLAQAQYNLARMYQAGDGVQPDCKEAANWLRKAAAQNYLLANNRLGVLYERGEGVPQDLLEAYKWYTLAARGGSIAGVVNRDNLKARMTPQQLADAERLVQTAASHNAQLSRLP